MRKKIVSFEEVAGQLKKAGKQTRDERMEAEKAARTEIRSALDLMAKTDGDEEQPEDGMDELFWFVLGGRMAVVKTVELPALDKAATGVRKLFAYVAFDRETGEVLAGTVSTPRRFSKIQEALVADHHSRQGGKTER